jgi:hypothetical protein
MHLERSAIKEQSKFIKKDLEMLYPNLADENEAGVTV